MADQVYNLDFDVSGGGGSLGMDVSRGAGTLDVTVNVGGDISAILAEKWAVGKARGVPVPETDITYENNAKWYAQDMARIMNNVRIICYAVCETAGNVQVKTVTVDNYRLTVGSWVVVRFMNNNTVLAAKLDVSGTGARWMKYNNRTLGKADLNTRQTYLFIYDGTDYQLVGMTEIGRVSGQPIGYKSIGFGDDVEASGSFTAAFGKQTRARDQYAAALGVANHDTRGDDYDRTRSYATGDIVRVPDGYEFSDGTALMIYGEWYFQAKQAVPAGQEPVNDAGSVNTTYWKRIPKLLLTVGNGQDEDSIDELEPGVDYPVRRNAMGLDEQGNAYFDGDVYVNSDARSTSGTRLVSHSELDALVGHNSGIATLDSSGHVPAAQLPSYVDDVIEYADTSAFPATGETGKIYVALDTGKVYRWAGTTYAVISDYVHPAYTARTGKPAADQTPAFGGTFIVSQVESDAQGHVTAMTDRTVTFPSAAATASAAGLMSAADKAKLDLISDGAAAIDDTAGAGDDDVTWSADKLVDEAFCIETGVISSLPMTITDSRITEECTVEDFVPDERVDLGWVTEDGKLILYGTLPSGTTMSSKKLRVHRVHGLTSDLRTVTLRQQNSNSENGNYLVAEAKNLIPGVQYTFRLYSVAGGVDTYVYGIGTTTHYPSYNMWFQQAQRGLTDGTVYKVTVGPTVSPQDISTSNTVTFEAADLTPEEVSS